MDTVIFHKGYSYFHLGYSYIPIWIWLYSKKNALSVIRQGIERKFSPL